MEQDGIYFQKLERALKKNLKKRKKFQKKYNNKKKDHRKSCCLLPAYFQKD